MGKKKKAPAEAKSSAAAPQWQALSLDYDAYAPYLEESNMSDAQKREFIEALWEIVVCFVDLAFDDHPNQQTSAQACELNEKISPPELYDMIKSFTQSTLKETKQATDHAGRDFGSEKEL